MFFRKKGKLKKEYDQSLLRVLDETKDHWNQQRSIDEMSVDYNLNIHCHSKIAEAKYFFLFREAKHRKIVIKR
ncbi:YaaL family protein [Rossellomorea aquimaris]|uniref:YaaL family protein n=1 Tax=Rossellomorea aquimaris TaxID=189382 RepID=UPI001CFEE936|nr:YaaL family protein [Rossellomorea aquimaris]